MSKNVSPNELELTAARVASLDLLIAYAKSKKEEFITKAVDQMSAISLMVKAAYVVEAAAGKVAIDSHFKPEHLDFAKDLSLNDLIAKRNSLLKK